MANKLTWLKKGLIFKPSGEFGWMNTHAQIPSVLVMKDRFRVYFSTRTVKTESKTTFLDLDLKDPAKILYIHDRAILENGESGTFDEHGVMPSSVLEHNGEIYLYYSGWSRRTSVPYSNLTGLAVSRDGVIFEKIGKGPIISTSIYEPFSATSPHVYKEGNKWHMFYCSGTGWNRIKDKYEHVYDIKYASSSDGKHWHQNGKAVISSKNESEAITRPVVFKKNDIYLMLFCYRGSSDFRDGADAYRLGYASSTDLMSWKRNDELAGLNVSEEGWDCKMIAYPYIVQDGSRTILFYNGNGFGEAGFGYAILQD